jgi:hypothetical protein
MRTRLVLWASFSFGLTWSASAAAYRPFDGTDADVADPGEIELEFGPVGYLHTGSERFLAMPAVAFNYGISPDLEAVLEGRENWAFGSRLRPSAVEEVALSLKSLLRSGSLQDNHGLSVAIEAGVLLAASTEQLGVHVASIFSQRWPALTLHLNVGNDFIASIQYEASASLIFEGPETWQLRPVAEARLERDFGNPSLRSGLSESVLAGAIASCGKSLSFDLGLRYGRTEQLPVEEARLGLTWSFETR